MRVLMVSDVYFPRVNGVSTSIQTFRADLRELGHEVDLVAPAYPHAAPPAVAERDDDAILRIPARAVPRDPEDRAMSWRRLAAMTNELARRRPDVVHVQTPFVAHYAGIRLARQLGIPAVATYHTYFEHYLHHYVPVMPAALLRAIARRFTVAQCSQVDLVLAPSQQMEDALRRYGVSTPIEVLPTGLPRQSFAPGDRARFRLRHRIGAERSVALYVGRVAHEKNIGFLIRMLVYLRALVPDVLLIVAGEGPARSDVQQQVRTAQLTASVLFLGYLDRTSELPDCYRAADAFVFASRTETQGLVLIEALAQGTPVVSTAVMGTVDVLEGAAGAIVVDEDERLFAESVARVLQDPALRTRLSAAAAKHAQRWSSRALALRLAALYAGLRASPDAPGTVRDAPRRAASAAVAARGARR